MSTVGPVSTGRESVSLGGAIVSYELRRSARKTLGISVGPDGGIVVTAPAEARLAKIEAVLKRKGPWIRRQQLELASLPPPPAARRWVSGETHRYLGRQHRLKVTPGAIPEVKLVRGRFLVVVRAPEQADAVQCLMENWYRRQARTVFARRMDDLIAKTPLLGLKGSPPLLVRRLKTRWGSCSPSGRILMNVESVKLALGCIDYLLLHEICHLKEPSHAVAFWRLLERCMPDWERWRRRLDRAEV